jgi:hypothetical protein
MGEWNPKETPWLRREDANPAKRGTAVAQCYFCGDLTAKLSYGDAGSDNGRVEVYCDNQDCEARETVVIVERDSHGAGDRADVRALKAVDEDSHTAAMPELTARGLGEIMAWGKAEESQLVRRRMSTAPIDIAMWGPGTQ